jgi:hypothetical protein
VLSFSPCCQGLQCLDALGFKQEKAGDFLISRFSTDLQCVLAYVRALTERPQQGPDSVSFQDFAAQCRSAPPAIASLGHGDANPIDVLQPDSETKGIYQGGPLIIRWRQLGRMRDRSVQIHLLRDDTRGGLAGATDRRPRSLITIAQSVCNVREYVWQVPRDIEPGSHYKILVQEEPRADSGGVQARDQSFAFSIAPAASFDTAADSEASFQLAADFVDLATYAQHLKGRVCQLPGFKHESGHPLRVVLRSGVLCASNFSGMRPVSGQTGTLLGWTRFAPEARVRWIALDGSEFEYHVNWEDIEVVPLIHTATAATAARVSDALQSAPTPCDARASARTPPPPPPPAAFTAAAPGETRVSARTPPPSLQTAVAAEEKTSTRVATRTPPPLLQAADTDPGARTHPRGLGKGSGRDAQPTTQQAPQPPAQSVAQPAALQNQAWPAVSLAGPARAPEDRSQPPALSPSPNAPVLHAADVAAGVSPSNRPSNQSDPHDNNANARAARASLAMAGVLASIRLPSVKKSNANVLVASDATGTGASSAPQLNNTCMSQGSPTPSTHPTSQHVAQPALHRPNARTPPVSPLLTPGASQPSPKPVPGNVAASSNRPVLGPLPAHPSTSSAIVEAQLGLPVHPHQPVYSTPSHGVSEGQPLKLAASPVSLTRAPDAAAAMPSPALSVPTHSSPTAAAVTLSLPNPPSHERHVVDSSKLTKSAPASIPAQLYQAAPGKRPQSVPPQPGQQQTSVNAQRQSPMASTEAQQPLSSLSQIDSASAPLVSLPSELASTPAPGMSVFPELKLMSTPNTSESTLALLSLDEPPLELASTPAPAPAPGTLAPPELKLPSPPDTAKSTLALLSLDEPLNSSSPTGSAPQQHLITAVPWGPLPCGSVPPDPQAARPEVHHTARAHTQPAVPSPLGFAPSSDPAFGCSTALGSLGINFNPSSRTEAAVTQQATFQRRSESRDEDLNLEILITLVPQTNDAPLSFCLMVPPHATLANVRAEAKEVFAQFNAHLSTPHSHFGFLRSYTRSHSGADSDALSRSTSGTSYLGSPFSCSSGPPRPAQMPEYALILHRYEDMYPVRSMGRCDVDGPVEVLVRQCHAYCRLPNQ